MKKIWALLPVLTLFWVAGSLFIPVAIGQEDTANKSRLDAAQSLLESMTPEEKVGQLFLVTFTGSQLTLNSEVVDLIVDYHIGGVMLQSENDNFSDESNIAADLVLMNNSLQELAILGRSSRLDSNTISDGLGGEEVEENNATQEIFEEIPIFIGTTHGGGETAELQSGLTQLPRQLAIGSTWQPDAASTVGQVLGRELEGLGFNLLFNPSLNVAETEQVGTFAREVSMTDSFGESPYWVGLFAENYIFGVKEGSNGRIAVIGSDFPGAGGSDRPLNSEIATVRKTLQEMQDEDLVPFMMVSGSGQLSTTVDGFLTAHLRYQGLQGNIDTRSNPISFDGQALETLFQLEPMANWREEGGMLVSGELGAPAIQQFYATADDPFPHRRVAKDALLAGNDLLYTGDFAATDNPIVEAANIKDAINWFVEQYSADPTFRVRVDEAALRILQTKIEIYDNDLSLLNVLVDEAEAVEGVGSSDGLVSDIVRNGATQLSPRPEDNPEPLPGPPNVNNAIIVFTDSRQKLQCTDCKTTLSPNPDSLQDRILSLYGPDASNQVNPARVFSFSFDDLEEYLDSDLPILVDPTEPITSTGLITEPISFPTNYLVQDALANADWVVFLPQNESSALGSSSAMNRLLSERPEVLGGKVTAVFALGYPVDLDSTAVSQVTAYYALYDTGDASIDTAARILFGDLPPRGASPISVNAVRYDLDRITAPNPAQIIGLTLINLGDDEDNDLSDFIPGDNVRLQTGIILDYNNNPVPDGTLVEFIQEDRVQGGYSVIADVPTSGGRASFDFVLSGRVGQFRLRAAAGQAIASDEVDIAILENDTAQVEVITPTPEPTSTPTQTPIPTATATEPPTETPTPTSTPILVAEPTEPEIRIT
ncbi:MAG: glycoside hydrolase family 3 N-terminal domain-containing protein, partial [Chloroflexota bacterium]